MRKTILIAGVAAAGLAASASAQLVVVVDDPVTPMYFIDVNTGTPTALTAGTDAWGIAADDANQTIYAVDGSTLFKYDYATFTRTEIGSVNVSGAAVSMTGLTFGDGKLWGVRNTGGDGGATPEALYTIDVNTGDATVVYDYASADYDFGGLGYDPMTGLIYGTSDDSTPLGRGLYAIDPVGMTVTFEVAYPGSETDIDGGTVGDGKFYFVTDQPGDIYVYNLVTKLFETPFPAPWTTSEVFSGAAWAPSIPAPASLALLALGGLLMGNRRRRA